MSCDTMQTWMDRIGSSDEDTDNWLKLNTKKCPNCGVQIMKNQGCMHMTCRACKYDFCWLCLGDYRKHREETGTYLCNSFADVEKIGRANKQDESELAKIERDLKKLEFYSTRF